MPKSLPLNPALAQLPVYQPGRPIDEVARELGLPASDFIKLASNENPLGPSPAAIAAMEKALRQLHLYPDGNAFYLKRKMAEKLGVSPGHLILGNGSNEIIEFVGHALMAPGAQVVVSQYCFAIYPIMTRLFGADLVTVPAKDYGHDLQAMSRAITDKTHVVFVANPNNPTGTLVSPEALRQFIDSVPSHVLIVMDEAYIEFLENPCDLIPDILSGRYPNLLLMRTFSKIYGLAGLRLGYGIANPELIQSLEKVRQPFNINALIQAGALAALDDADHIKSTREQNRVGLAYYTRELAALGLEIIPSAANFIMARVGSGQAVFEALQRRGVITRPMGGYQLPEWLRISVGTAAENARCIAALRDVMQKGS